MSARAADNLNFGRKLLLAIAGLAALAGPVTIGILHAPLIQAQSPAGATPHPGLKWRR
jgi:hypothetical protein